MASAYQRILNDNKDRYIRKYGEQTFNQVNRILGGGDENNRISSRQSSTADSGEFKRRNTSNTTNSGKMSTFNSADGEKTFYTKTEKDGIIDVKKNLDELKRRVEQRDGDIASLESARQNLATITAAGDYSDENVLQLSELDGMIGQKERERDSAMAEFVQRFNEMKAKLEGVKYEPDHMLDSFIKPTVSAQEAAEEETHKEYQNMLNDMFGKPDDKPDEEADHAAYQNMLKDMFGTDDDTDTDTVYTPEGKTVSNTAGVPTQNVNNENVRYSVRPQVNANNAPTLMNLPYDNRDGSTGLSDEESSPEPSPSPMTAPPPVEEGHEDMEAYEEELADYYDAHDAWEEEVEAERVAAEEQEVAKQQKIAEIGKKAYDTIEIRSALGGLQSLSDSNDIGEIIQEVIDSIDGGNELSDAGFFETHPMSFGSVYTFSVSSVDVQMEVLSQSTLPQYGGEGTDSQEGLKKLWQLLWPPFSNEVTTTLGVMEEAIEDYYNPGKNLKPDDIRITIISDYPVAGEPEDSNIKYKVDYFFRGTEFLYSIVETTGVIEWGDYISESK